MKLELFNNETNKLWRKMSSESATGDLRIELELYKKLLNFFQVGDYYYFIFNIRNLGFDLVSPHVEKMLGYTPAEFTVPFLMDCIHPEDRPWFLAFETSTAEFLLTLPVEKLMKYKTRYDFRCKKKNGDYIRVLHQVAVIEHDEQGGIIRTLGVHTDITHLKPDGKPVVSYIGMDGEPSYLNVDVKNTFVKSKEVLSGREKQVLMLLMEGRLSKEIGSILNISKQTVDSHRKNMIHKNNLNNTSELIVKAIKEGWV
jgi:DNA-binding CsgD family transcriptional regulator